MRKLACHKLSSARCRVSFSKANFGWNEVHCMKIGNMIMMLLDLQGISNILLRASVMISSCVNRVKYILCLNLYNPEDID